MRQATSRITANVVGSRRSVSLVPGTVVDLDEVIGDADGHPLTLEQALGPDLVAGCDLAMSPVEETGAGTRSARSRHQTKAAAANHTDSGQPAAHTGEDDGA